MKPLVLQAVAAIALFSAGAGAGYLASEGAAGNAGPSNAGASRDGGVPAGAWMAESGGAHGGGGRDTGGKPDADGADESRGDPVAAIRRMLESKEWRTASGYRKSILIAQSIARIPPERMPEVAGLLMEDKEDHNTWMYLFTFLEHWSEIDPAQAKTWFEGLEKNRVSPFLASRISHSLASIDPEGALAWATALEDPLARRQAVSSVIQRLAVEDPRGALRLSRREDLQKLLGGRHSRYSSIESQIFSSWAATDPVAAAAEIENIGNPMVRQAAIRGVIGSWHSEDPEAALRWATSLTNPADRNAAVGSMIQSLSQLDPTRAIALIETLPPSNDKRSAYFQIAMNWSRSDPDAAIGWINTIDNTTLRNAVVESTVRNLAAENPVKALELAHLSTGRDLYSRVMPGVLSSWLEVDQAAALAWLDGQPDDHSRNQILGNLGRELNPGKADLAMRLASRIRGGEARSQFLADYAGQWANLDPRAAVDWYRSLPADVDKSKVAAQIARNYGTVDPRGALAFADSLPAGSEEHNEAQRAAIDAISMHNAPQAAALAMRLAGGSDRANTLTTVISRWTSSDPVGASEFLDTLPEGNLRNRAVQNFALNLRQSDPEAAAHWAASISDDATRRSSLRQVMNAWKQNDRPAALAFLRTQPLSEDLRKELLELIQK